MIKIPSTVIRVGQEISAPESRNANWSGQTPPSPRPADDLPFEILYEDDDLICYLSRRAGSPPRPTPGSTPAHPGQGILIARDANKAKEAHYFVN